MQSVMLILYDIYLHVYCCCDGVYTTSCVYLYIEKLIVAIQSDNQRNVVKQRACDCLVITVCRPCFMYSERDVPILFYIVLFPVVCTVVRLMLFLLLNDAHTNTFHFGNELLIGE